MRMAVTIRGCGDGPGLRELVERRLAFVLGRHADQITTTTVVIDRVDASRSAAGTVRMVVIAVLRSGWPLRLVASDHDPAALVDVLARRAERALRLRLESGAALVPQGG